MTTVDAFEEFALDLDARDTANLEPIPGSITHPAQETPTGDEVDEPTEWSGYVLTLLGDGWKPLPPAELHRLWADAEFSRRLRASIRHRLAARGIPDSCWSVDDVHQETLVCLLERAQKTPIKDVRKFVYANILRTIITDAARAYRRSIPPPPRRDEFGQDLDVVRVRHRPVAVSGVEEIVLRRERVKIVLVAKSKLTHRQREVLEGLEEQGNSRAFLAAKLEISEGALSGTRHRALDKLREFIAVDTHPLGMWIDPSFIVDILEWLLDRWKASPATTRVGHVLWAASLWLPQDRQQIWLYETELDRASMRASGKSRTTRAGAVLRALFSLAPDWRHAIGRSEILLRLFGLRWLPRTWRRVRRK